MLVLALDLQSGYIQVNTAEDLTRIASAVARRSGLEGNPSLETLRLQIALAQEYLAQKGDLEDEQDVQIARIGRLEVRSAWSLRCPRRGPEGAREPLHLRAAERWRETDARPPARGRRTSAARPSRRSTRSRFRSFCRLSFPAGCSPSPCRSTIW